MSSSRTKRKRPRDETPDEDRPLCSWKSLPKEVLQLKCNKHNLSASGSVAAMASRLYTFFHEEPAVQDNPGEQEATLVKSLMPGIQQLVRDELSRLHTKGSSTSSQKSKSKSKDRRTSTEDNVQQPGPSKGRGRPAKSRGSRRSASSSSSGSFRPTSKKHRPSRPKSASVINSKKQSMKPKRKRTHSSSSSSVSVSSSGSRSSVDSPPSSDSSDSGEERRRHHVSYFNSNFAKAKAKGEHRKLPPISAAQLRKIRRREYIDFDNILSSALYAPAAYNGPNYELNLTSASTLSVKATNTAKPRVVDFHTWLEA